VVFNDVLEENVALLVVEVELYADYLSHKEVKAVVAREVLLAVLDVLLISKEIDELNHLRSVLCFVMIDKSTKSISPMYLNRHQSVVAHLTNFDFAIGNLVIYV
jgi:hypothetical protein